jgi:hypothetical protein
MLFSQTLSAPKDASKGDIFSKDYRFGIGGKGNVHGIVNGRKQVHVLHGFFGDSVRAATATGSILTETRFQFSRFTRRYRAKAFW